MTDNVFRVAEVIAKSDQIVRTVTHGIVWIVYITAYYTDTIKRGESLWQR